MHGGDLGATGELWGSPPWSRSAARQLSDASSWPFWFSAHKRRLVCMRQGGSACPQLPFSASGRDSFCALIIGACKVAGGSQLLVEGQPVCLSLLLPVPGGTAAAVGLWDGGGDGRGEGQAVQELPGWIHASGPLPYPDPLPPALLPSARGVGAEGGSKADPSRLLSSLRPRWQ